MDPLEEVDSQTLANSGSRSEIDGYGTRELQQLQTLPVELLLGIFRHLHPGELARLQRVSRSISKVASDALYKFHVWVMSCSEDIMTTAISKMVLTCEGQIASPLRTHDMKLRQLRRLHLLVPISPQTTSKRRSIRRFAKLASKFTSLRELKIIVVLCHPHEFYGGKRWKNHEDTTNDIISSLRGFESISGLTTNVQIDLELPKSKAAGYDIDMSHYKYSQTLKDYETFLQQNIRQTQTKRRSLRRQAMQAKEGRATKANRWS